MVGRYRQRVNDSLTVGELCEAVEYAISTCFPEEIWVQGMVAGISRSRAGHVYFDFVDANEIGVGSSAVLSVTLFAGAKARVNAILRQSGAARITDGVELKIRGRVNFYPPQGRIQLIMSSVDPAFTLGQLELARAKLLTDLEKSGLLRENARNPVPPLPLRLALITSHGSAAEADFLSQLATSGYPFEVYPISSLVQGPEAPTLLTTAIGEATKLDVDAIALIRGGGAQTDLAAFDHPDLAQAIARSPHPVVTGIGHETDRSVADHVAHTSLKTPTAAASFFVDRVTDFESRLDRAANRIGTASAMAALHQRNRLDSTAARVLRAAEQHLQSQRHQLDTVGSRAKALDPILVMKRGWSITLGPDGHPVTSVRQLAAGDHLVTHLADGTVSSDVASTSNNP